MNRNQLYCLINEFLNTLPFASNYGANKQVDTYRMATTLCEKIYQESFSLSEARPKDAKLLWVWANEPSVRQMAFNSGAIPWEDHQAWFARKLADQASLILILQDMNEQPCGQIRFDLIGGALEIDLSVPEALRRQGIGRKLLTMGLERAKEKWPGVAFKALILNTNLASKALFKGRGFKPFAIGEMFGKGYGAYILTEF